MPTSTKQNTPQNAHRSPLEPQKINLGTKPTTHTQKHA